MIRRFERYVVTPQLMLVLEGAQISRAPFIVLKLIAMAVKATLITGNFMHLRSEQAGIIMTVVIGLFVCGLVLYVPGAARIHEMVNGR